MSELTCCLECGMPVWPNEYHPFAACLMFRACQNSMIVRANLPDIRPVQASEARGGEVSLAVLGAACDAYAKESKAQCGEYEYFPDAMEAAIKAALRAISAHTQAGPVG